MKQTSMFSATASQVLPNRPILPAGTAIFRWRNISWLYCRHSHRRTLLLAALLLCGMLASLCLGATMVSPRSLGLHLQSWLLELLPWGSANTHVPQSFSYNAEAMLLWQFRLPRILAGALAGSAFALAGLILQLLSHNPLAAPDTLGMSDGACLALFVGLLMQQTTGQADVFDPSNGGVGNWWLAPVGAGLAVLCLFLLAGKRRADATLLLLLGMALASLLRAFTELALASQPLLHASSLYSWSIGNLNGRNLASCRPLACALLLALPILHLLRHQLALLYFPADLCQIWGMPIARLRWLALLLAITLAGLAIGLSGPLAFIALVAPYCAKRMQLRGFRPALPVFACALLGALLVVCADSLGRLLLNNAELPAGVLCNLLGGPFLLWALQRRRPA